MLYLSLRISPIIYQMRMLIFVFICVIVAHALTAKYLIRHLGLKLKFTARQTRQIESLQWCLIYFHYVYIVGGIFLYQLYTKTHEEVGQN